MNSRRSRLKTRTVRHALVLALLGWLLLPGCFEYHCCPRVGPGNISVDAWVCPAHCPNGGKTVAYGSVRFVKDEEPCIPESYKIYIYNVTDNKQLPPLVIDNPEPGRYQFKQELMLTKDTTFQLRAMGDEECGLKTVDIPIKVVDPGKVVELLRWTEKKNWVPPQWWITKLKATPGVLLQEIHNRNKFEVRVKHLGLNLVIAASDAYPLAPEDGDVRADGLWEVEITDEFEYTKYANEGKPPVKIDAILRCDCP